MFPMPARDANGKKVDLGDMMKNSLRNNFHFAMTGRALPPGSDGGDFVKDMAPIWAMQRMRRMQRLQAAQQHILNKPARDRAQKAAANARYVEYIRRVQSQIPPSLRTQKSPQPTQAAAQSGPISSAVPVPGAAFNQAQMMPSANPVVAQQRSIYVPARSPVH